MRYFNQYSFLIALLIVFIQLSPIVFLGKSVYLTIPDGLEYLPMHNYIAHSGKLFASNNEILPHLMNGLPRVSFPSEWNVQVWLYYFLDPFYAYSLNLFILHFVAFIGARLLIKRHILPWIVPNKEEHFNYNFLVDGSALYFALLPHWPLGGLSIAGMPLLLYSFLNFYKKINSKWDWFVIITYPFYSSFYFSNMFFLLILLGLFTFEWIKHKKLNKKFLLAIISFVIINIFTEYRLFLSVIQGFESHREIDKSLPLSSLPLYKLIYNYDILIKSYMDAPIKIFPFVVLCILLSASFLYIKQDKKLLQWIFILFILILFMSYLNYIKFYVLSLFNFFPSLKKLLTSITFRSYVLNPLLWLVLFSIAIISIYSQFKNTNAWRFSGLFVTLNILYLLFTTGTTYSYDVSNGLESTLSNNLKKPHPNYREYFDEQLFQSIHSYIKTHYHLNPKDYKCITINNSSSPYPSFSSMIPFYFGFYTIDGYCTYFSKTYKNIFEELILNKYKLYNKAYIPFDYTHKKLDINFELFKQLKGKFILSPTEISEPKDKLKLVNTFQGIYWKIYLYEVL